MTRQPIGFRWNVRWRSAIHDDDAGVELKRLGDIQPLARRKGDWSETRSSTSTSTFQSLQPGRHDGLSPCGRNQIKGASRQRLAAVRHFRPNIEMSKRFRS